MSEQKSDQVYKAGCVQAAPVYFDAAHGVEKTIALIHEAADAGARLLAFPECWIPGYPWWAWLDSAAAGMRFVQPHFDNCLTLQSEGIRRIAQAAIDRALYVVLGYSEREGGSLYIAPFPIHAITPKRDSPMGTWPLSHSPVV